MDVGTVLGSRLETPGGCETLTQVPSLLITTWGKAGLFGLRTKGLPVTDGGFKVPPLARRKTSVSSSLYEPSALGTSALAGGLLDLDLWGGLDFGGRSARGAGDLSAASPRSAMICSAIGPERVTLGT